MKSEREFIASVEAADVDRLAELLRRPSREEEELLRIYFGDDRYRRMHSLALQNGTARGSEKPRGNVVVLHGIMGGELARIPPGESGIHFWLNLWRIAWGEFERCRLGADGRQGEHDIRATGILKRYYGELLLSLSKKWNVRPFWFDWRKDIRLTASALESQIRAWFDEDEPVHLVAHSMGGLVARAFMKDYSKRWQKMADKGSKLVMLGTPNYGSFAITQLLTGTAEMIRLVARLDLRHSLRDVRSIASTFPGCYQMLPSPAAMPAMEALYQPDTWQHLDNVSARHLQLGHDFHNWLGDPVTPENATYIAGFNQPTPSNITDLAVFRGANYEQASNTDLYDFTADGDGTVPHTLGFLKNDKPIFGSIYFVEEEHGSLPSNRHVIEAVEEILSNGSTRILPSQKPTARDGRNEKDLKEEWLKTREKNPQIETLAARMTTRARNAEAEQVDRVSNDERKLESLLTRSFLFAGESRDGSRTNVARALETPSIEIGLICGEIDQLDYKKQPSVPGGPIDCMTVGHYIGGRPQAAVEALDLAISRELLQRAGEQVPDELPERDRLITQYINRGIVRGELGQPFFLVDPRRDGAGTERLIAIAGMGLPGQFGMPELTVLAREVCWSLGQLGKRHLLAVLIGGGAGNLPQRDAVHAWLRGIAQALNGADERKGRQLERVTFVERDLLRLRPIRSAILASVAALKSSVTIRYVGPSDDEIEPLRKKAEKLQMQEFDRNWRQSLPSSDKIPTRITVQMVGDTYWFGAITAEASIPERSIKLDPRLVNKTNDKLATATEPAEQWQLGRFMERLLIPQDLRAQLSTDAPLVMVLDRTTANLHWELLAQPEPGGAVSEPRDGEFKKESFLGTARGFTRQLRTIAAPPPEPPPPPRRVLRVLVIADPAADAPLPGAEQEGIEVADLIESFNTKFAQKTKNRVEVERLFGPIDATRENVLQRLMLESWDVLHFAGHCFFDPNDPTACGWIFGMKDREILSANELTRIDRVPKFVFSNACESGITPDRSDKRDPRMAPSFAETFFHRGVANFVCTAWPIDDNAARLFAHRVYSGLLGLENPDNPEPEPIFIAMREARCQIASQGGRTWGAYQHYGNPNFRLFDAESFQTGMDAAEISKAVPEKRTRRKGRHATTRPKAQGID